MIPNSISAEDSGVYKVCFHSAPEEDVTTMLATVSTHEQVQWESDFHLADSIVELLKKSVLLFHKSRQTMMLPRESISAVLPGGKAAMLVHKKMSPLSVTDRGTLDGQRQYAVKCMVEDNTDEYLFEVDESELPVASWEHRFWLDCGGDVDHATPLLNAILAFHKAGKIAV